ncbi:putative bifunctional diguanylate cyclase/phosphodiesterase [Maritalea porphyrae]|uniref:GGDEF-domain containing protein n=1 Tax=Maritalea porphyrae TaxID=880732 RepID=A0ABQ5UUQ6_9HYPH|nr:EAL domain-containing protein [Maritalea porphyrae]GLQ18913.1 GGDEF-domain containing protein [Maritalea porphyrae]
MDRIRAFFDLYRVPIDNPEFAQAQLRELAKRMPMIYFITCVSSFGLALTQYQFAPPILTIGMPMILTAVCAVRLRYWVKEKHRKYTYREAIVRLRGSVRLAALLGFGFVSWSLSLYPFGDAVAHSHIAFFVVVTIVGVTCCLLYLRAAAMSVATAVLVPFCIHYIATNQLVHISMAFNAMLVVGAVAYAMLTYNNDFARLISGNAKTRKLSNDNLKLANLDSLTGLPNRRKFFEALESGYSTEGPTDVTVGLLDIDGFKPINDVYGHIAGDQLLVEVGNRLSKFSGDTVTVARLGGDEFGFLVQPALDDARAKELGEAICKCISEPIHLAQATVRVSASIGLLSAPVDGSVQANQLFEKADHALYFAKQNSRGQIVIYSAEHEKAIRQRSFVETELKNADLEKELTLAFQPIFDQRNGKVAAVEALARWSKDGVQFSPDVFIRQAERCGMMGKLTEVLLSKALRAARAWPDEVSLSFNLSAADIGSEHTMAKIVEMVTNSRFPAHRITFEITETSIVRDFDQAEAMLLKLKELGAKIALDDFGTGFSSLSYLQRLPFDRVKLDQSFVATIEHDPKTQSIVRSVIRLVRELGISVVAEGIENKAQRNLLLEMDCRLMQGFLLSRPISSGDLLAIFRNNGASTAECEEPPVPSVASGK